MRIRLSGGKYVQLDAADHEKVKGYTWYGRKGGSTVYAMAYDFKRYAATKRNGVIAMHRLILDAPMNLCIDHINSNGLDNRRSNLRLCTPTENARHKQKFRRFKGVYRLSGRRSNPWGAFISVDDKFTYLGSYANQIDAAKVYDDAAKKHYGEFAGLNFP